MNIPQVNAGATDHNHEQAKRICELNKWLYEQGIAEDGSYVTDEDYCQDTIELPNGAFTLCQVVGMLEAEGAWWFAILNTWGCAWNKPLGNTCNPHDLTAAMDALIKVLEAKKNPAGKEFHVLPPKEEDGT